MFLYKILTSFLCKFCLHDRALIMISESEFCDCMLVVIFVSSTLRASESFWYLS